MIGADRLVGVETVPSSEQMLRRRHRGNAQWSIYDRIAEAAAHGGVGLLPGGDVLPDEPPRRDDQIRWIEGGLDGVASYHGSKDGEDTTAPGVAQALATLVSNESDEAAAACLRNAAISTTTMSYVDRLPDLLHGIAGVDRAALRSLGRRLATTSGLREEVKLGMALIGFTGVADCVDVVLTLGRHEEFTLFAAVALANGLEDPYAALWSLALHVDGWGRIQTVKRLAGTTSHEIKSWLLRDGFRNVIMDEYLAYTAAVAGDLAEALRAEVIDEQLWIGAGDILSALIAGGPAEDMDDYDDGPEATKLYLHHAADRDMSIHDFNVVASIHQFLSNDDERRWNTRIGRGWTEVRRRSLAATCTTLLAPPRWRDRIEEALHTNDDQLFWKADRAAHTLGIRTFETHFERLQADPGSSHKWLLVMRECGPNEIHEVLEFAVQVLPLDEIGGGPGTSLGLGPGFEPHRCLDAVLQDLRRFPRNGWTLIRVGINSPVVRNRNMALKALQAWDSQDWPPEARRLLDMAAAAEPNQQTKDLIAELLSQS